MNASRLLLLIGSLSLLSACGAITKAYEAVGGKVRSSGGSSGTAETINPQQRSLFDGQCPDITIVDELSVLNEFNDPGNTNDSNIISSVAMKLEKEECATTSEELTIDLNLAFHSELGPQAKIKDNDKPFFAYPFFVAVTDPEGTILAKEVFAASMTYDRNEDTHTYYEQIRQIIPKERRSNINNYKIYLGFQLNDQQLTYNRANMASPMPLDGTAPVPLAPPMEEEQQDETP